MLLPFGKDNPVRTFPLITACLAAVNVVAFVVLSSNGPVYGDIVFRYGLNAGHPTLLTLFSYMFLHADLSHLLLNMLFLWVFGPNVEDLMGRLFYLVFYLACGLAAAGLHLLSLNESGRLFAQLIGASGAITGIMGAYFVLFPLSRIVIFPFFIPVHAFWFILIWIYMQLRSQVLFSHVSNVAFMAHIGGFVFGAGILFLLLRSGIVVVPHFELVKRGRYASLTEEDILAEAFQKARKTGEYSPGAAAFAALMGSAPGTSLQPGTLLAAADAALRTNAPDLAVAALRKVMADHPHTPQALSAGLEIARIALNVYHDPGGARGYLNWVIGAAPQSPHAREARVMLARMAGF